jgi:branched-chain amino acid aminotransferase
MSEEHNSNLPNSTLVYRLFEPEHQPMQTNRGLLFGDGFFESILQINGHYPLLEYHLKRIRWSADLLNIDSTSALNHLNFELDALKTSGMTKIKVIICRSDHGNYTPLHLKSCAVLLYLDKQELKIDHSSINKLNVGFSDKVKLVSGLEFTKIKSLSALPYVMAGLECRERKKDDLLLLNDHDEIAECISSNIFLLRDKKWMTPPLSDGCVAGVMREYILDNAKILGIQIEIKSINKYDLENCDGILVTNAIRGARVVSLIENIIIPDFESTMLAKKINEVFYL